MVHSRFRNVSAHLPPQVQQTKRLVSMVFQNLAVHELAHPKKIRNKGLLQDFDITFCDEAHNCAGNGFKRSGLILDETAIKSKKRLFMTATERVYKGDSDKIISMDDEEIYGKVIHQLSFKHALEQNPPVLSKPAVHIPTIFAAGIFVKLAASPTNEVAVHTPV